MVLLQQIMEILDEAIWTIPEFAQELFQFNREEFPVFVLQFPALFEADTS